MDDPEKLRKRLLKVTNDILEQIEYRVKNKEMSDESLQRLLAISQGTFSLQQELHRQQASPVKVVKQA